MSFYFSIWVLILGLFWLNIWLFIRILAPKLVGNNHVYVAFFMGIFVALYCCGSIFGELADLGTSF